MMTLITRYVRRRGEWVAMVTNIFPDQVARAEADPDRGEEEAVHVPNVLAVRAPALLAAAKRALTELEGWVDSELAGTSMHEPSRADLDYLRDVIADADNGWP